MNAKESIINNFSKLLVKNAKEVLSHLYDVEDGYDLSVSEIDGVVRVAILDQSVYSPIDQYCLYQLDGLTVQEIENIIRG